MKLFAVVLAALALLTGFAGGFTAFSAASPDPVRTHVAMPHHPKLPTVRPLTRWAPCHKPAVLEGRACVTHVVHTVTLAAPVAPAAPAPAAARAAAPQQVAAQPGPARPAAHHEDGGEGAHDDGGEGAHDD